MINLVYDSNGKLPRFVIHENKVVNQRPGEYEEVAYTKDWLPAYIYLLKRYRSRKANGSPQV